MTATFFNSHIEIYDLRLKDRLLVERGPRQSHLNRPRSWLA
jgi:hypothetical protein